MAKILHMRILITSNDHPHYNKVGRITGTLPPAQSISPEPVYIIELDGGERTTVINGEYKVIKLQDA